MSVAGFRNTLRIPRWLSNRPGLSTGFKTLYSIAVTLDALMEGVQQGIQASLPGLGPLDGDPIIGRSRGFVQGPSESSSSFEARLRAWLQTWQNMAGDEVLCELLQAYVPGAPVVRIVNRANQWVSLLSNGTFSYVTGTSPPAGAYTPFTYAAGAAMDWDQLSNPERTGEWSDVWIVIEQSAWPAETRTLSSLASAYGTFATWAATGWGIGLRIGRADRNQIDALVKQALAPHCQPWAIIWATNDTDFNPLGTLAPTGYCGPWAYMTDGNASTPYRPAAHRYQHLSFGLPDTY